MFLTEISLKRPVFATVTILALVTLGLTSYFALPVDEWPSVEFPFVTVSVPYKGAAPEQVDSKVVQKVEEAVSSVAGVKHIYSYAKENVANVVIEFTLETSPTVAAQDVRDKVNTILSRLPEGTDPPIIDKFDINLSKSEIFSGSPAVSAIHNQPIFMDFNGFVICFHII